MSEGREPSNHTFTDVRVGDRISLDPAEYRGELEFIATAGDVDDILSGNLGNAKVAARPLYLTPHEVEHVRGALRKNPGANGDGCGVCREIADRLETT